MSRDLDLAAADLLDRAADYITEHGWTRGAFERNGRVCAYSALLKVNNDATRLRAENLLRGRVGPISRWNDAQKSRRPVIRTLRSVAAGVRSRATDGAA